MKLPRLIFALAWILFAGSSMTMTPGLRAQDAQSQPAAADAPTTTIKAETRLVLVDTIVTDKKGNYITDLTARDFKVWEDNKEQPIKSFSAEKDAAAPSESQRRYMVIFFDNSSMNVSDQAQARAAAAKFIDDNAGPNRYMAIMDYGGTLSLAQNFTTNAERLKKVVHDLRLPNAAPGSFAEAVFGVHTVLLAIRSAAKSLAGVPGRKSLILLTAGFQVTNDQRSELLAVIDTCNKDNVAVYPIDVRGLVTPFSSSLQPGSPREAKLVTAALNDADGDQPARLVYVQQRGGGGTGGTGGTRGGGGTGGTGTGGTGGRTGGTGTGGKGTGTGGTGTRGTGTGAGYNPNPYGYNPYSTSRSLIPTVPDVMANQQVLYELAEGTGGFVIANSNDVLGGLQKIAREQTQYYILGYTPPPAEEESCHTLKVKVERSGTVVRARSGYCDVKPTNLLAGKPVEKQLENRAAGSQAGTVAASMLAPYFYTSINTARVNLAMEIPPAAFKFSKEKGKQHAAVDVLGLAYKSDGTVAARFSDTITLDLEGKKEVEEFGKKPYHYESQFDVAAGQYNLKVVFSSGGEGFGKLETPLAIDTYDGKHFTMSGVALSKELHPVSQMSTSMDAALLEDRTPLVAQGMQVIPAGTDAFKQSDLGALYFEIYDPLLQGANPPKVGVQLRVLDRKTGEQKVEVHGPIAQVNAGNPVVPVGMKLPLDKLPPGSYRLELKAVDSAGSASQLRTADFEVQ